MVLSNQGAFRPPHHRSSSSSSIPLHQVPAWQEWEQAAHLGTLEDVSIISKYK